MAFDPNVQSTPVMIDITGGAAGNSPLMQMLTADLIEPGANPSYELCKQIFAYHPLGGKMTQSPVKMAQAQKRQIAIQKAPDEVVKAFEVEWTKLGCDDHICNTTTVSRIYGIGSVAMGAKDVPSDKPLDMTKIWQMQLYFNVLDPLNTAGSLVFSQISTAPDFNKPVTLATNGETFHASRYRVIQNEDPIFLMFTSSAFGFVGRSVYQRALYALKSFIRLMIANDMIATKLGLLVAKTQPPGPIINKVMQVIAAVKRTLLKQAQTGQVLQVDKDEDITTLNMQNVDGAGNFARTNVIKDIATAADMPAILLENETLATGFADGTEDAKTVVRYIEGLRMKMQPLYAWFDNIVMYRAWNPAFFARIQRLHAEEYGQMSYEQAFSQWREKFTASWPSLLIEPRSETIQVEDVKLQALCAVVQTLLPLMDPQNKALLVEWMQDNLNDNEHLFQHNLVLDFQALAQFADQQQQMQEQQAMAGGEEAEGGHAGGGNGAQGPGMAMARKAAKFDSSRLDKSIARLVDMRRAQADRESEGGKVRQFPVHRDI